MLWRERAGWTPNVTLGARDPFGNSEANIGSSAGLGTVHNRAYYAIVGKTVAGCHINCTAVHIHI